MTSCSLADGYQLCFHLYEFVLSSRRSQHVPLKRLYPYNYFALHPWGKHLAWHLTMCPQGAEGADGFHVWTVVTVTEWVVQENKQGGISQALISRISPQYLKPYGMSQRTLNRVFIKTCGNEKQIHPVAPREVRYSMCHVYEEPCNGQPQLSVPFLSFWIIIYAKRNVHLHIKVQCSYFVTRGQPSLQDKQECSVLRMTNALRGGIHTSFLGYSWRWSCHLSV